MNGKIEDIESKLILDLESNQFISALDKYKFLIEIAIERRNQGLIDKYSTQLNQLKTKLENLKNNIKKDIDENSHLEDHSKYEEELTKLNEIFDILRKSNPSEDKEPLEKKKNRLPSVKLDRLVIPTIKKPSELIKKPKITQKTSLLENISSHFREYHNFFINRINNIQKRISDNIKKLQIGVIHGAVNKVINKIIYDELKQIDKTFVEKINSIQDYITSELAQNQKEQAISEEHLRLLDDCMKVKGELKKFAQVTLKSDDIELTFETIKPLLSIYRVLIEKIWQGQAHYRILHILHGDKKEVTRDQLKMSSGIEGAFLLRAIKELARVNLIEYDEKKDVVKLTRRLFPKVKPEN
ncbi:MAG: hypothetical protein ACFFBP_10200 [Promethearchaeota archaeon]